MIQLGKSKKSESNLPDDLRNNISNILASLKDLLSHENNSLEWYQQLSQTMNRLKGTITSVANIRTLKAIQKTSQNQVNPPTAEQTLKFKEMTWELMDQIIRAKYENNPN